MALQLMIKKKPGKKDASLYFRYSVNDSECLISTGKKIPVSDYPDKISKPLDKLLNRIRKDIDDAESEVSNENGKFGFIAEDVKTRYTENTSGIVRGAIKAVTLWEQFIKEGEGKKEEHTIANEMASMETFKSFCEEKKKGSPSLRKITKELIAAYESYLAPMAHNTRAKKLKHFKAFLKSVKHPCTEQVKFKETPGDKIYLTEAELTAVEQYKLKPEEIHLDGIRNLLLLQCATGLRVSDLFRLGPEHVQGDTILLRAKKNDSSMRMPMTDYIKNLLLNPDNKLPRINPVTYNLKIKDLLKVAIPQSRVEITERRNGKKTITKKFKHEVFTSHDCVRTYITLAAGRGMSIPSIAAITGKSIATLLRNYLEPDKDQAFKDAKEHARPLMAVNVA